MSRRDYKEFTENILTAVNCLPDIMSAAVNLPISPVIGLES